MPDLAFEDYITCFKKQFTLQKGRGGRRISPYYTNYNGRGGSYRIDNAEWGIMVFIYTGTMYGFSDAQMLAELRIDKSLYEHLKEKVRAVIRPQCPNKLLHNRVVTKIGLVKNMILFNHAVRPSFVF